MISSYFRWLIIASMTVLLAIPAMLISFFSPSLANKTIVKFWGKIIIFSCNVQLEVTGVANIKDKPLIVMYNHKSMFDIFCFASFMKYDWRAMMKKELLKIPFFGQTVKIMGHYFVSRDGSFDDRREVVKMLKKIKNGRIVFIAPEGTRNPNPGLMDFKNCGFYIAKKTDTSIVPMIIKGSGEIVKIDSLLITPGKITIEILPEIDVSAYSDDKDSIDKLREDVFEIFLSKL